MHETGKRAFLAACVLMMLWAAPGLARDRLVLGLPVEPTGLDPTIAAPIAIREVTWGNVFEGLTTLGDTGNVEPLLAKSWTLSPDAVTYRFVLQPNVKFHNGVPFDCTIVKFSLDRARASDSTNAQKPLFEPIASVDCPEPLEAVITLKRPVASFLYDLAWGDAAMVEPSTVLTNRTAPNGTGPFKLAAWRRGDRIELERNPSYWDSRYPKLDHVTFRFIGDAQAQAAALRAGDIDGFPNFGAPELFGAFAKDPRFKTSVGVTPRKLVAGLNCGRSPLSDMRVRQAMMSAVDRKMVIDGAYSGFGTPIGSHYAPSDPGYIDTTGVLPFDPAKTRQLLTEAGYPNGFTVTIKTPQMPETTRTAEILQAMLADVGITLTIVPSEFPAKWIDEVFLKKDYDVTIIDHAEPNDIEIYSRSNYYFDYHNPEFDALIEKSKVTQDRVARDVLLAEAQTILAKTVPALYLFDLPRLGIVDAHVEGLWPDEPISQMIVKYAHWTE